MPIRNQNTYRNFSAQSVTVGSVATSSTTVFGSQTYTVRLATVSPAMVKYIIGNTVVASAAILSGGALLPPNCIEYVTVSPGQFLTGTTSSVSAVLDVTECAG